ncbi:hypothetical protein [Nocardiopsis nanhaiensis]
MFGPHGPASAPGARAAVLSAPLRRVLVLVGLLMGTLLGAWILGASTAEAEEIPLFGDAELVDEAQPTEDAQPAAGNEPVLETEPLEDTDPVGETLTGVTEETTETARDVSETVVPEVSVQGTDIVDPVHDTLDGVTAELDGHIDDTVTGLNGQDGEEAAQHPDQGDEQAQESGAEPEPETPVRPHEGPHVVDVLPESVDTATEAVATDDASGAETGSHHHAAQISAATAAANSGAAPGAAVAGFLPVTGAPAPEPGLNQAARHVLYAVPSAGADEPTFAPD